MTDTSVIDSLAAGDQDDTGAGLADLGASVLSGIPASIAGLGTQGALRALGVNSSDAYGVSNRIQDAIQYQPRTEFGKQILGMLGQGFNAAANSAPVRAIADPITNQLQGAGVQDGDIAGLTAGLGFLVGGPESRVMDAAESGMASQGRNLVNIGLHTNVGGTLTADEALAALRAKGLKVQESAVHQSNTEPTLVARTDRALTPEEGDALSSELSQDAIAQNGPQGGALYGPKADEWGPFNPDFFLDLQGRRASAPFPQYADRYPDVPEPEWKIDKNKIDPATGKKGKPYQSRGNTPETDAFMEAREQAQNEIDAGNYIPHFDVQNRYYADPSSYNIQGNTLTDTLAKKQETIDAHRLKYDTPEARQNLNAAFDAANGRGHNDWYAMGQMQDSYIDELGMEEGLRRFKSDIADAMAATTASQDPTGNLIMAHYNNFMRERGLQAPTVGYQIPHPVSGPYMGNNVKGYQRMVANGGMTMDSPKGFNFSANILGDMDRGTVDKRMTQIMTNDELDAPPNGTYGIMENMMREEAAKRGLKTGNFQDVAWAGKDPDSGKPLIQHYNEALQRTSRLTGLTTEQVLRRNLIRRMGPIFGVGGAAYGLNLLNQQDDGT